MSAIRILDNRGNEIYSEYQSGFKEWREYDKNNNMIHLKNSNGDKYWFRYEEEIKFKKIRITEKEFKKKKVGKKNKINRFEIMDI